MMETIKNRIVAFHKDEEGGDIVQTAIIIGVFAIIAIGAITFIGPRVREMFDSAGDALEEGSEYSY